VLGILTEVDCLSVMCGDADVQVRTACGRRQLHAELSLLARGEGQNVLDDNMRKSAAHNALHAFSALFTSDAQDGEGEPRESTIQLVQTN
jgi:hypothetical protein